MTTSLNEWGIKNLGTWVVDCATMFLIAAVALFLLLIITVIIAIVVGFSKSQKIRKLKAEKNAGGANREEIEQQVRTELYPQIYAEIQNEYADSINNSSADGDAVDRLNAQIAAMSDRIDAQHAELTEKQARIDELTAALNSAGNDGDAEYERKINELNGIVRDKENEINLLKAENSQIKAQALQQQLADRERKDRTPKQSDQPARAKTAANKQSEPKIEAVTTDDDDEYDEYYDDFGDASSAVKVTLKFDRNKNSWIILRSDTDRTYRRMATKQDALVVAKDLARRLHAQLVVHKKDGKFQKI